MNMDLQPIHSAGRIVSVGSIQIDAHILRIRSQTGTMKTLAAKPIDNKAPPTCLVSFAQKDGITVVPFRREAFGINDQELLIRLRRRNTITGFPVHAPPVFFGRFVK